MGNAVEAIEYPLVDNGETGYIVAPRFEVHDVGLPLSGHVRPITYSGLACYALPEDTDGPAFLDAIAEHYQMERATVSTFNVYDPHFLNV